MKKHRFDFVDARFRASQVEAIIEEVQRSIGDVLSYESIWWDKLDNALAELRSLRFKLDNADED